MRFSGDRIRVRAPGKINLFLEVIGRRSNGYHDIRSVLVPVSVFDELEITRTGGAIGTTVSGNGSVQLDERRLENGEENLATRAARALQAATGYRGGAHILLEKHIPVGGGLGGGSADAAAVLTALNALWGTGLSVAALAELGAGLGCDVPALVHGGAVLVEGLGERVTPLGPDFRIEGAARPPRAGRPTGGWWVVLVNPGFSVSTADIYSRCSGALTSDTVSYKGTVCSVLDGDVVRAGQSLFNGLQAVVFRKYPLIEMLAQALAGAGAEGALLSGSGATVFGLARGAEHAAGIEARVRERVQLGMWTKVAQTLPDGVMAAHGPLEA